jgi:putative transposase
MWLSLKKASWRTAHLAVEAPERGRGVNVSSVCLKLGMSRQNYYAQRRRRQREKVDGDLVERLAKRERCVQPRLGGRKLHRLLQKELAEAGVELGRDRFFKVLAEHKLLLEPKAAAFPCTTHSRHNRFSVFGTDYR